MPSTAQALPPRAPPRGPRAGGRRRPVRAVGIGRGAAPCARHQHPPAQLRAGLRPLLPGYDGQPARQVRDDLAVRPGPRRGDGRVDELHRLRGRPAVAGPVRRRTTAAGCSGQFRAVFRAMLRDEPQDPLALRRPGRGLRPTWRRAGHRPVVRAAVPGRAAAGRRDGTGWDGRTVVRISMHAWNGERGVVLARRVVALRARGLQRPGAGRRRVRPAGHARSSRTPGRRATCDRPGAGTACTPTRS